MGVVGKELSKELYMCVYIYIFVFNNFYIYFRRILEKLYWQEILLSMQYAQLQMYYPKEAEDDVDLNETVDTKEFNRFGYVTKTKHVQWVDLQHELLYLKTVNGWDMPICEAEWMELMEMDDPHFHQGLDYDVEQDMPPDRAYITSDEDYQNVVLLREDPVMGNARLMEYLETPGSPFYVPPPPET